ncbi:MAG: hypothetical protein NTV46_22215 [Verrucomicrobia bacterium]|nr:hypothetical protein [Verrucomicrobiota bacterium]
MSGWIVAVVAAEAAANAPGGSACLRLSPLAAVCERRANAWLVFTRSIRIDAHRAPQFLSLATTVTDRRNNFPPLATQPPP